MALEIPNIPKREEFLDRAFGRASKKAEKLKVKYKVANKKEILRIEIVGNVISESLLEIVKKTFSYEELNDFYKHIIPLVLDLKKFKSSLSSLSWASKKILELKKTYVRKVKSSRISDEARKHRRDFYGRVNSILKSIEDRMEYLRLCRKNLKKVPVVKQLPTVVIAGFPNVGKTSLLKALTGSEPEIKSYPFTTKGILVGYREYKYQKIQFIDTPGLLDRPLEERNKIELQAVTALKYLADVIVYVFDPTETCGYLLKNQENLLKEIKKEFKIPIIPVENKSDLKKGGEYLKISTKTEDGIEILLEKIRKNLNI